MKSFSLCFRGTFLAKKYFMKLRKVLGGKVALNLIVMKPRIIICLLAVLMFYTMTIPSAIAEPTVETVAPIQTENDEDLQQILQSSLSIVELDKEIERIGQKLEGLQQTLTLTAEQIDQQEVQISNKREQAGKVLLAYYMGERDGIIFNLLKSDTFEGFLLAIEFIELILSNDKQILTTYVDEYRVLQSSYGAYKDEQNKLITLQEQLQLQRNRVSLLEQQIDQQLTSRSDAERIQLLIEQLTTFWEEKGLIEVQTYFQELAKSMNELPGWLQENQQYISMKGFKYKIELPDDALNSFLRGQNEMFNDFAFTFEENSIIAKGQRDNIEIELKGHYSLVEKPTNYIEFTVDELYFNGFLLPDPTKNELEAQFNLNFYPSYILSMLRAKSVAVTDGILTIELQLVI